ncbi:MAG TPA: hypothetical protein VME40_10375 [Caulobacteraceae bacterium]|nr:hypothetical protein [Caulobacteraceae bacterium]
MSRVAIAALTAALLLTPALAGGQTASDGDQPPPQDPNQRLLTPDEQGRQGVVNGVVEQPFRDFNVIRSKIPPVLTRAMADPYARPPPGCAGIAGEVSALDTALGPDLDEPVSTEHPGTLTRAEGSAKTGALDAMRSGVQSEIPFDGFIRMLSGAQRHDKLVMAAIQAGAIRRGYLKGLGESLRCTLPAAPRHLAHPVDVSAR